VQRLASCGREFINTVTIVVDSEGSRVEPGQLGEIITRGDLVSPGYWRKEKETQKA